MTKSSLNNIIKNFEAGIAAAQNSENTSSAVKNKADSVLKAVSDAVKEYANEMEVIAPSKINESVSGFTDSYLTSSNLYKDKGNGFVKLSILVIDNKVKIALNANTSQSQGFISEEASATKANIMKFAKAYVALCQ